MNRSDMHTQLSYPTLNTSIAIEMQKAEAALQKVKKKITDNPKSALRALRELDKRASKENQYAAWTKENIKTEVQKLDLEFVKPLITPENPASVDKYEIKIENEITKTLQKRVISHHTDEERAHKLYLSLKNAHEAKQQRAEGKQEGYKEKETAAEKLWQEAHQPDPAAQERAIKVLGEGACGKTESVFFGEAGPILVKKTSHENSPETQQEFRQEVENLQALNHPNIIRAVPTSLADQSQQSRTKSADQEPNFIMQSGGQPLMSLVKGPQNNKSIELKGVESTRTAEDPLPMQNIKDITRQILSGLAHTHENGIVHLDIKPENVLVQPDGTVKIIDFGQARNIDDHNKNPMMSGSFIVMAPEIINRTVLHREGCSEECSEASDIYSAGCLLCQLVTGGQYNHYAKSNKGIKAILEQLVDQAVKKDELQQKMFDLIDVRYPHAHEQQQATQLKSLLSQMLEPDPANRPSAEALLKHPFFQ